MVIVINFVALYRGETIQSARLVGVTGDATLVAEVSARLLQDSVREDADPVISSIQRGRRNAIRLIQRELGGGETNGKDD